MNFYQANKITNDFKYQLENQRYRRQQAQKQLDQIRKAQQSLTYQNSQAIESFYARRQAELEAQRKAKMEAQQMAAYYNANAQAQEAAALEAQAQLEKFNDVNNYGELNSLADLIFNWGADYTLQDIQHYISNLPTARLLAAGGNLLTGNVDEAKENAKAALVNGLYALGEDADMVANIVKSQTAAKDKSDRLENLKSTVGLSEKYGVGNRVNYDYDTGSFVKDFALEFVSDPLNIISLGAKGFAKAGVKELINELPQVALKNAPDLATDIMQTAVKKTNKFLIRDITRNLLDGNDITVKQAIKAVGTTIDSGNDLGKASLKYLNMLDDAIDTDLISGVAKGAAKLYRTADKLDSGLLRIGLTEIGVYPNYRILKWATERDPHLKMHKANKAINKIQKDIENTWTDVRALAYKNSKATGLPIDTQIRLFTTIKEEVPEEFDSVIAKQVANAYEDTRTTLRSLTESRMNNDPETFNKVLSDFLAKEDCASLPEYLDSLQKEKDFLVDANLIDDNTSKLLDQQLEAFVDRYTAEVKRIFKTVSNGNEIKQTVPELLDKVAEVQAKANNKTWDLVLGKDKKLFTYTPKNVDAINNYLENTKIGGLIKASENTKSTKARRELKLQDILVHNRGHREVNETTIQRATKYDRKPFEISLTNFKNKQPELKLTPDTKETVDYLVKKVETQYATFTKDPSNMVEAQHLVESLGDLTNKRVDVKGPAKYKTKRLQTVINNKEYNAFVSECTRLRNTLSVYVPSDAQRIAKDLPTSEVTAAKIKVSNYHKTDSLMKACDTNNRQLLEAAHTARALSAHSNDEAIVALGKRAYAETVQVYAFDNLKRLLPDFLAKDDNLILWTGAHYNSQTLNKAVDKIMDRFCNYYVTSIATMTGSDTELMVEAIAKDLLAYNDMELNQAALVKFIDDNYIQIVKNAGGDKLNFSPSIVDLLIDLDAIASNPQPFFGSVSNKQLQYLVDVKNNLSEVKATIDDIERKYARYSVLQFTQTKNVTTVETLWDPQLQDFVKVPKTTTHKTNYIYSNYHGTFVPASTFAEGLESKSWVSILDKASDGALIAKKNTLRTFGAFDNLDVIDKIVIKGVTQTKDIPSINKFIEIIKEFDDLKIHDYRYETVIKDRPTFFTDFRTTVVPKLIEILNEVNPDCYFNFNHMNLDGLDLTDEGYYQLADWLINKQITNKLYVNAKNTKSPLTWSDCKYDVIRTLYDEKVIDVYQAHALLDPDYLATDKILTNNTYVIRRLFGFSNNLSVYDDADDVAATMFELDTDVVPNEIAKANWLGSEKEQVMQARQKLRDTVENSKEYKAWQKVAQDADYNTYSKMFKRDEQLRIAALQKTIEDGDLTRYLIEDTPGFVVIAPETHTQALQMHQHFSDLFTKQPNTSVGFDILPDESIIIYLKKDMDTSITLKKLPPLHKINAASSSGLPKQFSHRISGRITSTRLTSHMAINDYFMQLPVEIQNKMLIDPSRLSPAEMFPNVDRKFSFSQVSFDNTFFGSAEMINNAYAFNCTKLDNRLTYMYSVYLNRINAAQAADVLYLSEDTRVSFKALFGNTELSDKEIAEHFKKHTELVGIYWTTTDQGQRIPKVMRLTDPKAVALARDPDLNPLIIDRATASNFIRQSHTSKLRYNLGWETLQTLSSCIKAGYLSSPGWVMRNFTSTISKALLDASDSTDMLSLIPEVIKEMHSSIKRINKYTQCYTAISEYGLAHPNKYIFDQGLELTNDLIKDFFEDPTNAQWAAFAEDFDFIRIWTTRGYSDAMTKVLAQQESNGVIKGQSLLSSLENLDDRIKRAYPDYFDSKGNIRLDIKDAEKKLAVHKTNMFFTDFAWKNPYTAMLVGANNSIETYCRFFTLNWNLKHGADMAEAAERVRKAHFDYAPVTDFDIVLSTLIPFINFKIDNTKYWLDMLFEHTWLTKAIMDFYKAGEFYDLSREQVTNEDYSIQQILDGVVHFDIEGSNGIDFKLNGDYIDALQSALNPVEVLTDSMLGVKTLKAYIEYKNQRDKVEQDYLKQKELNRLYKLAESGISPDYRKTKEQLKASEDHYLNSLDYLDKQTNELFLNLIPFYSRFKSVKNIFRDDAQNSFMDYITSNNLDDKLEGATKLMPSVFAHNNQLYYYSYGNINVRTKDYAKYLKGLERGAKEGWAGISQPILPAKTYYAISFPNGKSFVSADLNKVTEWLHRGGLPVNDEARLLADSLDIDREVYGSTYYEDYQKQIYTQTNLAKQEAYITSKYGPRRTKHHSNYVPKYIKPSETETNVLGIAPINEPVYTSYLRPRVNVRPIRTLHNTYKNKRPIDTLAYRKRGR